MMYVSGNGGMICGAWGMPKLATWNVSMMHQHETST